MMMVGLEVFLAALVTLISASIQQTSCWPTAQNALTQPASRLTSQTSQLLAGQWQWRERRQAPGQVSADKKRKKNRNKKRKSFAQDCLAAHNKWRKLHQSPPLIMDAKVTEFAQKRADFIAASDGVEFRHPPDLPYGENLAYHSRESTSCADLIKMWYDEVDLYDYQSGKFSAATGHFTQLVWKSTKRVGCAKAISRGSSGAGVYLVCNYDEPGNFLGEFQANVREPVEAQSSTERAISTVAVTAQPTSISTISTTIAPTTTSISPTSAGSTGQQQKKKNQKKKKNKKKGDEKKRKGNKKRKNKNKKKKSTTTASPGNSIAATSGSL